MLQRMQGELHLAVFGEQFERAPELAVRIRLPIPMKPFESWPNRHCMQSHAAHLDNLIKVLAEPDLLWCCTAAVCHQLVDLRGSGLADSNNLEQLVLRQRTFSRPPTICQWARTLRTVSHLVDVPAQIFVLDALVHCVRNQDGNPVLHSTPRCG